MIDPLTPHQPAPPNRDRLLLRQLYREWKEAAARMEQHDHNGPIELCECAWAEVDALTAFVNASRLSAGTPPQPVDGGQLPD